MEQHIINGLRTLYPNHQFIGEESMAEVNIMKDLQEHNDHYEIVEADDEWEIPTRNMGIVIQKSKSRS